MALAYQVVTNTLNIPAGITLAGTAKVTVTGLHITGSPVILNVALTLNENATNCAKDIMNAINANGPISDHYLASDGGGLVVLTSRQYLANDTTLSVKVENGTCTGIVTTTSTITTAGSGLNNAYCTLEDLKSSDVLNTPAGNTDDEFLVLIINAVSRAIDNQTARFFYQTASQTRYFDAWDATRLFVGDMVSVTSITTDDGSRAYPFLWATTDYDLWPYNAPLLAEPEPYTFITITPNGKYNFPLSRINNIVAPYGWTQGGITKGIQIVGIWGWPEIPEQIAKACLLWSERTFKRFQTPLGISATGTFGQLEVKFPPPDPDVALMLSNYKRPIT